MHAYYYDNLPGDERLPHDCVPPPVSDVTLEKLGVKHWHIPIEDREAKLDEIASAEGYNHRGFIDVSKPGLGEAFEEKTKGFLEEHMHPHDESRFILEGSGYSDVRDGLADGWIRMAVSAGDFYCLPAGMYHRFSLDENDSLKALLLFKDEPERNAHSKDSESDASACRQHYLQSIGVEA